MEAQLDVGSIVEISVRNGTLHVRAVRRKKYLLKDLLKGIRPENLHAEIPTGEPVGREKW